MTLRENFSTMTSTDHTYTINTNSRATRTRESDYISILASIRTDPKFENLMINDMSFYSLVLMIDGFTEMDLSMDVLFTLFGNKSPTPYITQAPVDLSELMDCLVRTVSIKLPSLLKITTDGNLQIVRIYLDSDDDNSPADTPVSSGCPANKPFSSIPLPQVINTTINSPSSNLISVGQKTELTSDNIQMTESNIVGQKKERKSDSMEKPVSNIKNAKQHAINLKNFLGSEEIDDDAHDDDLQQEDVLQKEDVVFHKPDEWTTVQRGHKHSTPGSPGDTMSKYNGRIMNQNMFENFASDHVDDNDDDNGNHGIAFTQRSPTSDDVSRMSSNTSYRHRDVNSLTHKQCYTIVDRELKRLRNKSDTLMLKHKASVKDTCNGYLIKMNETFADLTEDFENDFLERKDNFVQVMETEQKRLDDDIAEMQYQRGLLKDFHKLLEGTKSNMESDFIKQINSKLDARVTVMLNDEAQKNSSFRQSLDQDIDHLRCDIHDIQKFIPSDESHSKKNIFQDMNDLAVILLCHSNSSVLYGC